MCDPVSATMTVASFAQGITGYKAGRAEGEMYGEQSRLTRQAATRTEQQGLRDEEAFRSQVRQFVGKQRAAIGASGIVGSEGSAAVVQDQAVEQGELDALQVRNNAYLEAWGLRNEAKMLKFKGKQSRYMAGATLLTSALQGTAYAAQGYAGAKQAQKAAGGDATGPATDYYMRKAGY